MPRSYDPAMPGCTGNTARIGCDANGAGSKPKRSRAGQGCGPTRIQRPLGSGGVRKKGHRRRGSRNFCRKRSGCCSEGHSSVCKTLRRQDLSGTSSSGKSFRVLLTLVLTG